MIRRQVVIAIAWALGATIWCGSNRETAGADLLSLPEGGKLQLGSVPAGKHVVRFALRNDADQRVFLEKVSGSCTCMDIDFDDAPLMPGEVRECRVTINVQPSSKKSTAIVFDTRKPRKQRIVQIISFHGVQEDELQFVLDQSDLRMEPESERRVCIETVWRAERPIGAAEQVSVRIDNPFGVKLLRTIELERTRLEVRNRFVLGLDSRGRNSVAATLHFEAGYPVRVHEECHVRVPVEASLGLEPDHVLVSSARCEERLPPVAIELAEGWRIASVRSPTWIRAVADDDRLNLDVQAEPPSRTGVSRVEVVARDVEGREVIRKVKIVVDLEER